MPLEVILASDNFKLGKGDLPEGDTLTTSRENSAHAKIAKIGWQSRNLTFFAKIGFSIEMREFVMKSENPGEMKF